MNAKIFTLVGALVLLASGAATATLDPTLLGRLQALEETRRASRQEGLKDPKAWESNRAQRAAAHRQELATLWGNVVGSIDGQGRLRMNADRMARLNRMLDLAELKNDATLTARVRADITRELSRHAQAMQALRAETGMR